MIKANEIRVGNWLNDPRHPSMDHLDRDGNPILAWCRKQKFMILLNHINKDCIYNEK